MEDVEGMTEAEAAAYYLSEMGKYKSWEDQGIPPDTTATLREALTKQFLVCKGEMRKTKFDASLEKAGVPTCTYARDRGQKNGGEGEAGSARVLIEV